YFLKNAYDAANKLKAPRAVRKRYKSFFKTIWTKGVRQGLQIFNGSFGINNVREDVTPLTGNLLGCVLLMGGLGQRPPLRRGLPQGKQTDYTGPRSPNWSADALNQGADTAIGDKKINVDSIVSSGGKKMGGNLSKENINGFRYL